jgi:hypothetical protein
MKHLKQSCLMAAFALALALGPTAGWTSRVFTDVVTGEITATPLSGKIEVDHRSYPVKAGTPADQALHGFSEGQRVDLLLDAPPTDQSAHVIRIKLHEG